MTAVSLDWVLSMLAGMSFPEQGQAYNYIKRCQEASQAQPPVNKLRLKRFRNNS